jgi:hypothetical protein
MGNLKEKTKKIRDIIFDYLSEQPLHTIKQYENHKTVIEKVQLSFYEKIINAKNNNYLPDYCDVQYVIDFTLQLISVRLQRMFVYQDVLKKRTIEALGKDKSSVKPGISPREYLIHNVIEEKHKTVSEIASLKKLFNEILFLAKEIGFQVFYEEEFRYDWYHALSLSPLEVYNYFKREGIPKSFLPLRVIK